METKMTNASSSAYLLVKTDGYSIEHTRYESLEAVREALKQAWKTLYDDNMDKCWKEQSHLHEDEAILFKNGEDVYVWNIIEIPFETKQGQDSLSIIEKLELTENMLKNHRYDFKIILETEDRLFASIESDCYETKKIEYTNNKLYVNGEEKDLKWLKDFLFVCSRNTHERFILATKGKFLNILVNDKEWIVRFWVAKHGYGLDVLVNDEHRCVRIAVAKKRHKLDILINDQDWEVRNAVAQQGYGLNILINDKHWYVRQSIAIEGYGLNKLINDSNEYVVKYAKAWLKTNDITLEEWMKQYPERIALGK